jgi:hypothetical protein
MPCMKVHEATQPGPYWCSHDLAYWIPEGATYEVRWSVIELGADGHFYAPGSDVHITRGEIPDYVELAGPLEPIAGQWMPIETAPKDGTRILIHVPSMRRRPVFEAWWVFDRSGVSGRWCTMGMPVGEDDRVLPELAKNWMPIPEPPGS